MEVNDQRHALVDSQPATDPLILTVWKIDRMWGWLGLRASLDKLENIKSSVEMKRYVFLS
jgi:hypothetical protein